MNCWSDKRVFDAPKEISGSLGSRWSLIGLYPHAIELRLFEADGTGVTHRFEFHCDVADVRNTFEVNWGSGNRFHLDTLTSVFCFIAPNINAGHPAAPFNTYVGAGTGSYNGVPGATAIGRLLTRVNRAAMTQPQLRSRMSMGSTVTHG